MQHVNHTVVFRYVNLKLTSARQIVLQLLQRFRLLRITLYAYGNMRMQKGAFRWYSLSISTVSNAQVLFALCTGILSSAYCAPRAFHWFSDKALLFFNSVDRKQQERKLNHPVALSFCSPHSGWIGIVGVFFLSSAKLRHIMSRINLFSISATVADTLDAFKRHSRFTDLPPSVRLKCYRRFELFSVSLRIWDIQEYVTIIFV